MFNNKEYLVEIRVKDWISINDRIVAYEEVIASDEYYARHAAVDQFVTKTKFSPITKRKWEKMNLSYNDICAADAVIID
jgi:hypothetical protein